MAKDWQQVAESWKRDFNRACERMAKSESEVSALREECEKLKRALTAAASAMNHAVSHLHSPDMGGSYLERARDTLRFGESAARAALAERST